MQKELHLFNINGLDCSSTKRGLSLYIEVGVSKYRSPGSSRTINIATGNIFKTLLLLLSP
jgi:hypothetical protein